jgi:ribosomal protein S18 acetylase RimI-like enzyme
MDMALLVKFLQRTYQELFGEQSFAHLARTVDSHLSRDTPLWWIHVETPWDATSTSPVAGLWAGHAIDQVKGDRHAHIFLLYVDPAHRRQGLGRVLMHQAEQWARYRGDRQISLQVFHHNQPAIRLYEQLGYQIQVYNMVKPLQGESSEG